MGWQQNIYQLLIITSTGGFSGIFIYSPSPGAGNLVGSWTAAGGSDPYGNGYKRGLSVGNTTGPQVQLLPAANIPLLMSMAATSTGPSDVTSFSNLQQVIELPSNLGAEKSPPIIGETTVTYTDGSTADGLLLVSGQAGASPAGEFTMWIGASSTNSKSPAVLHGPSSFAAGTITLFPQWAEATGTGIVSYYVAGGGVQMLQQQGTLLPAAETWTAFNPLSNSWAVNAPYTNAVVRLLASPLNCIQFDADLVPGGGANNNNGTVVAVLAARFRPAQTKLIPATTDVIGAGTPRFTLDSSGNLKCFAIAAAATQIGISAIVPLDSN